MAENLVAIACSHGPAAVTAASEIANRLEGRAAQTIQITDFAADLQTRSDAELKFFLDNSRWPSDEEKALLLQETDSHVT